MMNASNGSLSIQSRFADAFANGEDDYPLELIKETNPEYEAR
jgi:hypothetical protein